MKPTEEPNETRDLYVILTPAELETRKNEMAAAERVLYEAEQAETLAAFEYKEKKAALQKATSTARARLSVLGRTVREKRETRAVEVLEHLNHEAQTVDTVRTDTGEIIESRRMTPDELQTSIFQLSKPRRIEEASAKA